jgi:hypothetical protein
LLHLYSLSALHLPPLFLPLDQPVERRQNVLWPHATVGFLLRLGAISRHEVFRLERLRSALRIAVAIRDRGRDDAGREVRPLRSPRLKLVVGDPAMELFLAERRL